MSFGVLVAGVGNIFLGDDGFGVEVVRRLQTLDLPDGVCVRDFGIRGYDLALALMEPWELVILIDTVQRGGTAGTLYVIEPDAGKYSDEGAQPPDSHAMTPAAVFRLVKQLGGTRPPTLIIGCEPAELGGEEGRMGLSPEVDAAVEPAIRTIGQLLEERWRPVAGAAAS
jgi:hydrogenase maturation protease